MKAAVALHAILSLPAFCKFAKFQPADYHSVYFSK